MNTRAGFRPGFHGLVVDGIPASLKDILEGCSIEEHRNWREIVRRGYDRVSEAYRADEFEYDGTGYQEIVSRFESRLAPGSRVLDLGCGCGVPVSKVLSKNFKVVGVDFSPVQIQRARLLVPSAEFLSSDMTEVAFERTFFDGIICLFAIIPVPREEQPALFEKMATWLKPGGALAITVGHQAWSGTEENWQDVPGATMYWSHEGAEAYREWIQELEMRIEWETFLPEGNGGHTVILARKMERDEGS